MVVRHAVRIVLSPRRLPVFQRKDALLQPLQEAAGVRAVHLGMVELEGKRQRRPGKPPAVSAPDEKGIVENAAVHADRAVKLGIHDGGGADDHAVRQVVVFAAFRSCLRQAQGRLDTIMEQMKTAEDVTEELKRTCQMEWVQRCNSIHNRAEEIILHEIIYSYHMGF